MELFFNVLGWKSVIVISFDIAISAYCYFMVRSARYKNIDLLKNILLISLFQQQCSSWHM